MCPQAIICWAGRLASSQPHPPQGTSLRCSTPWIVAPSTAGQGIGCGCKRLGSCQRVNCQSICFSSISSTWGAWDGLMLHTLCVLFSALRHLPYDLETPNVGLAAALETMTSLISPVLAMPTGTVGCRSPNFRNNIASRVPSPRN
jgi:hypothetical protein